MTILVKARIENLEKDLEIYRGMLSSAKEMNLPVMVKAIEKEVSRLESRLAASTKISPSTSTISDADIDKARNYPIENLLEMSGKNKCRCPFHPDKNPSASIKDNKFKCFVCGDKMMDTIALYRKLHDCNFITAVRALI